MPQKARERCIFHLRPYAYIFEMPQIRTFPEHNDSKMGHFKFFEHIKST